MTFPGLFSITRKAKKFNTYKISLDNKNMDAKFAICEKLAKDDKTQNNALILIVEKP